MKICKIEGCGKPHDSHGYCGKHSAQMRMYGRILDRTMFDKNEIILHDTYAEIVLYESWGTKEVNRAKIDLLDVDLVKNYKWHITTNGYVYTNSKGKNIALHRLIKGAKSGEVVDHRDLNPLNNRRDNLRICTQQQNMMNTKRRKHNTSGVVGVSWNKEKQKWDAEICVNRKRIKLGRYVDKEEAIRVRKEAEIKYFGEFRCIDN